MDLFIKNLNDENIDFETIHKKFNKKLNSIFKINTKTSQNSEEMKKAKAKSFFRFFYDFLECFNIIKRGNCSFTKKQ